MVLSFGTTTPPEDFYKMKKKKSIRYSCRSPALTRSYLGSVRRRWDRFSICTQTIFAVPPLQKLENKDCGRKEIFEEIEQLVPSIAEGQQQGFKKSIVGAKHLLCGLSLALLHEIMRTDSLHREALQMKERREIHRMIIHI
jgi:hypothetical protein